MPLVVPGINNNKGSNGQQMDWVNKLMGKKLSDNTSDQISFAKRDLPQNHRVIEEGGMSTMDHNPDRMNVHVDKDGTVKNVKFG